MRRDWQLGPDYRVLADTGLARWLLLRHPSGTKRLRLLGAMRTADHNNIVVKDIQLRERINHSGAGGPTRAVVENNDASSGEWQEEIYNPRTASTMAPMGIRTMALSRG
jgi:hypothetical protein